MKQTLLLLLLALSLPGFLRAKPIDPEKALLVASSYYAHQSGGPASTLRSRPLQLVYTSVSRQSDSQGRMKPTAYYYVFNAGDEGGFVIVAGDDNASPIIGYSSSGTYQPDDLPPHFAKWMEGYRNEIRHIIDNQVPATPQIQAEWQKLQTGGGLRLASTNSVSPLMVTRWNQRPFVNDLCPRDATRNNEQTVTGCVATAMAQVMKYWNYPATGTGFHSYNHPRFGTLSANFAGTTYNWAAMPNEVTSANAAVATLMYQVGVSVNMTYGVAAVGGSTAYMISAMSVGENCSEYALKKHFGYASTLRGVQRRNYTTDSWIQLLKTELDARRPVLYAGFGNGGGHAFVCDGYDANNFFHMNWGWGGAFDGFFNINSLNPSGVGTGGGTGGYNSGHQALIGVQPPPNHNTGGNNPNITLSLYAPVTPSAATIRYNEAFSVQTNLVASAGTGSFKGDYAAAVFDKDMAFVDFIQTYTNNDLPANNYYINGITFSTDGLLSLLPGDYKIGIFSRKAGGEWTQVANSGNNVNMVPFKVINPNPLELYQALAVQGGTTLKRGQPVTVTLDVANFGTARFEGIFDVSLYNLEGDFVEEIGVKTVTMNPNSHFVPALSFTAEELKVEPGTYYLALLHKKDGGDYEITGSTNFPNPIRVVVQEADLVADRYEANNTPNQATNLPLTFTGNTATVVTDGANSHVGNDDDYYKVLLAPGHRYTIKARVHDSYDSNDGKTYTNDVLFSYQLGTTWSDAYDDVMPTDIVVDGGGTLLVKVAPYYQGETGTYSLDLQITRSTLTAVEDPVLQTLVQLYPNPARDYLQLKLDPKIRNVQVLRVFDITGKEVLEQVQPSLASLEQGLRVGHLNNGAYIITVETNEGLWRKKFVKTN